MPTMTRGVNLDGLSTSAHMLVSLIGGERVYDALALSQ
jgi:hypothetical protein